MKRTLKKIRTQGIIAAFTICSLYSSALADPSTGSGDPTGITNNILTVRTIIFTIMQVLGGLFVAFGIVKAVRAHSKGMDDNLDKGIGWAIAGFVMAGIGTVLDLFGI